MTPRQVLEGVAAGRISVDNGLRLLGHQPQPEPSPMLAGYRDQFGRVGPGGTYRDQWGRGARQ